MTAATTHDLHGTATASSSLPLAALAEGALALVGLAAVIGLRRVFLGADWFLPLLVQVLAAHATVTLLRRQRISTAPAVLAAVVVGVLAICWMYAGELTTYGVPTAQTFDALWTSVTDAFGQFSDVKAPTEALDGFVIATAAAVWIGAILGDWAAFRAGAVLEAVLPSATLFGIGAVLGADVDRILVTGVWIATVLAFVLVRRADQLGQRSRWVGDRTGRGPRTLVALGGLLAFAAVAVAALLGPRLPGAESPAIVSLTDIGDNSPGTRVTVSPLVDIRSRLVDLANVEVFRVRSDVRSYWRLTSLDEFNGTIWKSNGSYGKTSGGLDEGVPVASDRISVTQQYVIEALSQIWLPAAYEPQEVDVDQPVRYDEVSGTLIVDTDVPTADGTTYGVVSALPQHRPDALASASPAVPGDIADRYLGLPGDFPSRVRDLADQITAGSTSRYEAALRLQNFFRDNFEYDLGVGPGHGDGAMESFLFELRRGYCEQFAGTFAAMARSLGIPARVAVGFTPGVPDPSDPNVYIVRGEHAHAWPEVYLGEYGWVAFEPTPGRGAPFAEQYTGVPEQQVQSGGDSTTATTAANPPSTTTPDSATTIPEPFPNREPTDPLGDFGTDTAGQEPTPNPWPERIAVAAAVLLVLGLLYLLVVLAVTAWRHHRRRRAAVTATDRVALAWDETVATLGRAGHPVRPSATQSEAAADIAARLPSIEASVRTLAGFVQDAAYAPIAPTEETGETALALADEIELRVRATQSPRQRMRVRLHPRRLLD